MQQHWGGLHKDTRHQRDCKVNCFPNVQLDGQDEQGKNQMEKSKSEKLNLAHEVKLLR